MVRGLPRTTGPAPPEVACSTAPWFRSWEPATNWGRGSRVSRRAMGTIRVPRTGLSALLRSRTADAPRVPLPRIRPLSHQLEQRLGLDPRLEAGRIDVERVADIAVVASAHSDGYAATAHLLGLLAALPAPTEAGERFWSELWRSSGSLYLLPANIKTFVLSSLAGEGTGLAGQILSAVDEMTPPQRVAAGEVIGQALAESDHLPDLKTQVIGELWLRDLELTAWRVLHADHKSADPAERKAFLDAWRRA